jgi:hypothetical protein
VLLSAFVALGRIFDQDSKHNIDSLMVIASKEFAVFSKASGGSQAIRWTNASGFLWLNL